MAKPAPYIDQLTDVRGQVWRVNDRILHVIPGVRSDAGKIIEVYAVGSAVRVALDSGGQYFAWTSDLQLVRRRTEEEIPMCAKGGS
jgi:hypothetical protein